MSDPHISRAFVLAGGQGTRLRNVLSNLPKAMAPVNGKPFLSWILEDLVRQEITDVTLCVGFRHEQIVESFGYNFKSIRLQYSVEKLPLGTGGAFWKGFQQFPPDGDFVVMNGDTFFDVRFGEFHNLLDAPSVAWASALTTQSDHRRYGRVEVDPAYRVTALSTTKPSVENFFANSGVWIGRPCRITNPPVSLKSPFSFEDYLKIALSHEPGSLAAKPFHHEFVDIGIPSDLLRAGKLKAFKS